MVTLGRGVRPELNYDREAAFCRAHGFDFMQLWYRRGRILLDTLPEPRVQAV